MKCVVNLYNENTVKECVFEIDETLIDELDEICINENEFPENIVIGLVNEFVEKYRIRDRC